MGCVLHRTLDVVLRIHNENILASLLIVAFVLRRGSNLPNFGLPELDKNSRNLRG